MASVMGPGFWRLVLDGRVIAPLIVADTWPARARGLLGSSGLVGALWLEPCGSVHMIGMRYPVDVATVDASGAVLDVRTLRPWSGATWPRRGARATVEAPAGFMAEHGVRTGSNLSIGSAVMEYDRR
ncbi:MAG: DUF192 domain-containing protein [Propionibacteriaceae bacterium]|jgi:uncharacterized membrane protein (UPF0127 family)|nr:DUF192 domain-containing protein [Propionibacteriaceae bacterium]